MSGTYDETLPTEKDEARALLGDTAVIPGTTFIEEPLRSDAHISAVIAKKGFALGVAFIADSLIAQFGQQPVKIAEDGSAIDYSARIPAWTALASRMRADAAAAASAGSSTLSGGVIALDFQEDLEELPE